MSRHGASTVRRRVGVPAHCLPKPLGVPAIQQQIACANLLNTASVVMTGRFQQPVREILSEQLVSVFVSPALPRTSWITEINR